MARLGRETRLCECCGRVAKRYWRDADGSLKGRCRWQTKNKPATGKGE